MIEKEKTIKEGTLEESTILNFKQNIKVICRIKPAKVMSEKDMQRNFDFIKSRQARSLSRSRVNFNFGSENQITLGNEVVKNPFQNSY